MGVKGDDIAERLLELAIRIIRLADALPESPATRHICSQVVRCGTSAGANYEEARGAESNKDFVHKLGICLKELRETRYWLKIIVHANLVPLKKMSEITQEADELCRIIGKSIVTSKRKASES